MTLDQIHEATAEGDLTASSFRDAALDCILLANETAADDGHDSALTQAMVYAELAVAAATVEASNSIAKSNYDGRP